MNSQKITRMLFLENRLICSSETEVRVLDMTGALLTSYFVDKANGTIADICLDGEHLFIATTNKQLALFDILQQKKIGNYFNDYTHSHGDKLPQEKELSCIVIGNDGLFVAFGGSSGTVHIIRS